MEEPLAPSQRGSLSLHHLTEEFTHKLMELEGECRVKEVIYLRLSYPKAILLTTLLTLSVIGLFLLKYFIKLRARVFYTAITAADLAAITHIYVKGQEGEEEISAVERIEYSNTERVVFEFKKLKYEIHADRCLPIGFPFIERVGELRREPFINHGLDNASVARRAEFYGKNEHRVEVPGYF
jgi:hypothetical protein